MQLEGYQWRDDRVWEKCAVMISYLLQPWSGDTPIAPQAILDAIHGKQNEGEFEKLAGMADPAATFDAMIAKQAARKGAGR